MKNIFQALLLILENPHIKKGYEEVIDYYEKDGRLEEAEAFRYLMESKFGSTNTHSS